MSILNSPDHLRIESKSQTKKKSINNLDSYDKIKQLENQVKNVFDSKNSPSDSNLNNKSRNNMRISFQEEKSQIIKIQNRLLLPQIESYKAKVRQL